MPRRTLAHHRPNSFRWILPVLVILLIGAVLRLPLLNRDVRFQVDEALYATISRQVGLHNDLLLIDVVIDKPPLLFWTMGGSFALFGVSEFAARLPNAAASLITLALLYALAKRLYRDQHTALLTMLLLAVSPFDRAFAVTAFTDPLLTMFVIGGCALAVYGRWRLAGLALALAFATKPSALQWLPLVITLGATQYDRWQRVVRAGLQMALGFAAGFAPLVIWSATRAVIPDFWAFNLYNNSPGRFIRTEELLPRFNAWLGWLNTIAPLPVIGWLSMPINRIRRLRQFAVPRPVVIDLILTTYTLASLVLWWLIAFPVYDRYLHTLAPLLMLLCARVLITLRDRFRLPPVLLFILVICSPLAAANLPVAGDPTTFAGIDQVATALNSLPTGTIVYDHSLGWELGYYLGEQTSIHLIWQPTVDDLIAAVKTQPGYWVAPRAEADTWLYLLRFAGIRVQEKQLYADPQFVVVYLSTAG